MWHGSIADDAAESLELDCEWCGRIAVSLVRDASDGMIVAACSECADVAVTEDGASMAIDVGYEW